VLTEDWHVRMYTASKGDFGSGPPGAVVHDYRVPFARPRCPALVLDAAFLELKRTIWSRLAPLTSRHADVA